MTSASQTHLQQLSFTINHWDHLYSLQKAIRYNQQQTGRSLTIDGQIRNHPYLNQKDTEVSIEFIQQENTPDYELEQNCKEHINDPILGHMCYKNEALTTHVSVDRQVFEELRKNLMEYADIDGIHIRITLGIATPHDTHWQKPQCLNILTLDYAMKGDSL